MSQAEVEKVTTFYFDSFAGINERTPIIQTWPRAEFEMLLARTDVVKYLLLVGGELHGLGVVTKNIELDSWLSPAYFAKHHPNKVVYNFMVITVTRDAGHDGAVVLIKEMMIDVVEHDAIVVTFHLEDRDVTSLARAASNNRIHQLHKTVEVCELLTWQEIGNVFI